MNVFKIERKSREYDWDVCAGHVIVAHDENEVRHIASKHHADEGAEVWLDKSESTVTLIDPDNYDQGIVILTDFRAG